MTDFNFEDWFYKVDIIDSYKKDLLKKWMISNDVNTLGAITGLDELQFPTEQWATIGIKASLKSAIISLRNTLPVKGK